MRTAAILFPGQGSLTPDAARTARAAWTELVERAAELVGDDPFVRASESTRYAQPATFVASLAGWRERDVDVTAVRAIAGHSVGELSALVAAGALSVEDGLELVVLRGRLMADAASASPPGAMVALLGGTATAAAELARRHGFTLANDNAPGQVVVSGERSGVDRLVASARSQGFKTLVLDVAGAFHSQAMAAAERPFRAALRGVTWREPQARVVSGYTAHPFEDFVHELSLALVNPVRWREVMGALVALGVRDFVDVGPGQVLAKLVKRNVTRSEGHVVPA